MGRFDQRFEFSTRGSDIRTGILAGATTFLTMALIPLTFSIANGLAFGLTAYALLKLVRGEIARGDWLLLVLALLFVVRFAWLAG